MFSIFCDMQEMYETLGGPICFHLRITYLMYPFFSLGCFGVCSHFWQVCKIAYHISQLLLGGVFIPFRESNTPLNEWIMYFSSQLQIRSFGILLSNLVEMDSRQIFSVEVKSPYYQTWLTYVTLKERVLAVKVRFRRRLKSDLCA